jgi:hypothetical protein
MASSLAELLQSIFTLMGSLKAKLYLFNVIENCVPTFFTPKKPFSGLYMLIECG